MRELTTNEIDRVSGGYDFNMGYIAAGLGTIALGVAIVGTAGLATVPIAIVGAATIGEIGVGVTGIALAAGGGSLIGAGFSGSDTGDSGLKEKDS
jgi:hypothetical protein